jgi:hypothetical protein
VGLTILLTALTACTPQAARAPTEAGVCWRMTRTGATPTFRVIERGVPNLETCAARMEVLRQQENTAIEGAYQAHFLFVDATRMEAARELEAPRFRILEEAQRVDLQEAVRRRLAAEAAPRRTGPPVLPGPVTLD